MSLLSAYSALGRRGFTGSHPLAALLLLSCLATPLSAQLPAGADDQRLTHWGPPGDTTRNATAPRLAWSATSGLYLAVWLATSPAGPGNGDQEVFAAMVDPETSALASDIIQVSAVGPANVATRNAIQVAVAWNSTDDNFLVVWSADDGDFGLNNGQFEIFGRRISRTGGIWTLSAIGPITDSGGAGGATNREAFEPSVAWSSADQLWLVAWRSDAADFLPAGEYEIFTQRVSGAFELLDSPVRVSTMGTDGGPGSVYSPNVVYHPPTNRFLVTWSGDDVGPGWAEGHVEIWGRAVFSTTGDVLGVQHRLTFSGPTDDPGFIASRGRCVWNRQRDRLLLVWDGTSDEPPLGAGEYEIWGQELLPDLSPVGGGHFRISEMGIDGDPLGAGVGANLVWEPAGDQYVVTWLGWPNSWAPLVEGDSTESGLSGEGVWQSDREIWGRALRLKEGSVELGPQIQVSDMGGSGPTPAVYDAANLTLALGPNGRMLVAWDADDDRDGMVDGELEIFTEAIVGPWIFVDDFESATTARWSAVTP